MSIVPPAAPGGPGIDRLPNGLSLVLHPTTTAPVVAIQVWVHVGGFDELDGERGLAHLHEHMLFKGTAIRGVGRVAAEIEAAGGQINAWTSHDQTCYHVVMPAAAWREGLEVLADAVCHSLFDPDELAREIEVVVEEIKRAEDSPGRVLYRRLFELIFAGHPYARPVLGTIESVRSISRERMQAFYDKHYVAPNITVVAAGSFPPEELRVAVQEAFADLGTAAPPTRRQATREGAATAAAVMRGPFSESRLTVAFPVPELTHEDVPALDVLAITLGQGDSSRLYRRVRLDKRLVNDIGASCYTPQRGGLFSVGMLTSADRLSPACLETLDVIAELLGGDLDEEEVAKARNMILAEATYKLETVQGQAHSLGYFAVACGEPGWERRYHARVAAVGRDEVLRAARRWLRPDCAQIVQMSSRDGPQEGSPGAPLGERALVEQTRNRLRPAARGPGARDADLVEGIELIELEGGDVLVCLPDDNVPVFSLRAAVLGGLRDEDPRTNGRSSFAARLLTRGTPARSGAAISHAVDSLAADLNGFSGRNSIGLAALSLSRHARRVLELFGDCLFCSALPGDEVEVQRAAQLEDIRHRCDAPARTAFLAMLAELYGDHPYALDTLGTAASVSAIEGPALRDWLRARLAPGHIVYAAAGSLRPDYLACSIEAFTPRDRKPLPPPSPARPAALSDKRIVHKPADKEQAHVCLGFLGASLQAEDRFALSVLSTLLSGQGGRLFVQLRDRQSLAYSVSSMTVEGVDAGYFAFYIGTSPDKVEAALAGLYSEIDKVVQVPFGEDELDRARRYLAGAHAIGLQRSSSRAATIGFNHLYGLPRQAYRTHLERLTAVTAEDILEAARRYLTVGRHVECVLAPNAR